MKFAPYKICKILQERQRIADEINKFRVAYQKKEDRREFDLYDPDFFKKLIPARLHDDDPRCGPASAQKFIKSSSICNSFIKLIRMFCVGLTVKI